jgi:hypothetical protein
MKKILESAPRRKNSEKEHPREMQRTVKLWTGAV